MAAPVKWSHTFTRAGSVYRAGVEGGERWWVAAVWCDCALGPHWHQLAGHARSLRALRGVIDNGGEER